LVLNLFVASPKVSRGNVPGGYLSRGYVDRVLLALLHDGLAPAARTATSLRCATPGAQTPWRLRGSVRWPSRSKTSTGTHSLSRCHPFRSFSCFVCFVVSRSRCLSARREGAVPAGAGQPRAASRREIGALARGEPEIDLTRHCITAIACRARIASAPATWRRYCPTAGSYEIALTPIPRLCRRSRPAQARILQPR